MSNISHLIETTNIEQNDENIDVNENNESPNSDIDPALNDKTVDDGERADNDHAYYSEKKEIEQPRSKFICSICDQEFEIKRYLIAHIKWKHCDEECQIKQKISSKEKSQNHKCNVCGKLFNSRTITGHINSHFADEENQIQCMFCDKPFSTDSNLKRHVKSAHEVEKKLKCERCDYSTYRKDNLERHLIMAHTDSTEGRLFECELCGINMKRKDNLKEHTKICTGKKKYMCEKCSKVSKTKNALWMHMKRYHS